MAFFGTPQAAAVEKPVLPAFGTVPVDLKLDCKQAPGADSAVVLAQGLRELYARGELCDLAFSSPDGGAGDRLLAHQAVLAAASVPFAAFLRSPESAELRDFFVQAPVSEVQEAAPPLESLAQAPPPSDPGNAPVVASGASGASPSRGSVLELQLEGVKAMKIVLDYAYVAGTGSSWSYEPSNADVNRDVLRISGRLALPVLREHAARWLVRGLSTTNVLERLATCEELGLGKLRERILEQLIASPAQLAAVSSSPGIMEHPRLLQDILVLVASSRSATSSAPGQLSGEKGADDKDVIAEDAAPETLADKAQDKPQKPDAKKRRKGA